jgi:hypothetical protein
VKFSKTKKIACGLAACLAATHASSLIAAPRPLLPGEQTIYESINAANSPPALLAGHDRAFFSQITGNAYTEEGDEVRVDSNTPNRFVTNIAVGTQTFKNVGTLEYTPAFLELSIYANDGPPDLVGDGAAVEATPNGQLTPGTLIARTRIPGPTYPTGGVGRTDSFVEDFVINFPFSNVLVPEVFTVAIVNLDHNGNPDITYGVDPITRLPVPDQPAFQPPSFRFGTWQDAFSSTNVAPVTPGDLESNNTTYNTNVLGTSRTGPFISAPNNGQWNWIEYPAKLAVNPLTAWENDRNANAGMEMWIYAVPEPASLGFLMLGLTAGLRTRRRRAC